MKMGLMGRPKTSVRNYHSVFCKIPEEHRFHLNHSGSLKSHNLEENEGKDSQNVLT